MTLQELINDPNLGQYVRDFIQASSRFIQILSENNITIDVPATGPTVNYDDDDGLGNYGKTYTPITPADIIAANKAMTEAIAGEKWLDGFVACLQIIMMFAGAAGI